MRAIDLTNSKLLIFKNKQGMAEGVPQPGKSSGKPISWISPEKVITKYLTLNEILNSVQGIPYYNEVVKDRDTKDFTWGVTKKVLEYARELIIRPDAYKNWPPIIVVDGKLQDGAHRISTINLMQKRVQPNNPIWKNAKLKVEFGESDNIRQGMAEGAMKDLDIDLQEQQWDAIVGYVINGLKKNMDIGRMELNLYKYAGQEMFDVDQALEDRGFKDIADLVDHILQHNGRYVPPTDFNLKESQLITDVPNEEWLQGKIDYVKSRGRNRYGVPYTSATTAVVKPYIRLPVDLLKRLPGMRGEQSNVRYDDLEAIMKIMRDTGKLPLTQLGKEYAPFVVVAYNGEAWVSEGNHRIMAAAKLGWDTLPVELKYYDGGERIKSGMLYPPKIGFGVIQPVI